MILDSGTRSAFDTGAVRDIQKGKGRCDLMPLGVGSNIIDPKEYYTVVISAIEMFLMERNTKYLYYALDDFAREAYEGSKPTMLLEVSKHFEEGAEKYGETNWRLGLPVECYMNSAIRHYLKYRRGDTDEPHDRAFVWNVMCCIWEVDYHIECEAL